MNANSISSDFALDAQSVDRLRTAAKNDPEGTLRAAARQFEALFMTMMLKSMRDASPQDGMLDSDQTRLYTSMLDSQLAQALSARGIGLAEVMVRQLSAASAATPTGGAPAATSASAPPAAETARAPENAGMTAVAPASAPAIAGPREFVNRLWPHAVDASRSLGLQPRFLVGQAALESGWGKREIRGADGTPSYNLFGIKSGRGWSGRVVESATTEYVNGVAEKKVERFRAYSSYTEAFQDYANLLRASPRYAAVLERGADAEGFARGLQQAGYATDPMYADKLLRILNGSTLRQSLLG